jgi:hypothetical protein
MKISARYSARCSVMLALALALTVGAVPIEAKTKGKPQKTTSSKKGVSKKKLETMGAQLGTDFKFNGTQIGGKFNSPDVGIASVEVDKPIVDLLDYDNNFLERSKASRGWK